MWTSDKQLLVSADTPAPELVVSAQIAQTQQAVLLSTGIFLLVQPLILQSLCIAPTAELGEREVVRQRPCNEAMFMTTQCSRVNLTSCVLSAIVQYPSDRPVAHSVTYASSFLLDDCDPAGKWWLQAANKACSRVKYNQLTCCAAAMAINSFRAISSRQSRQETTVGLRISVTLWHYVS